MKSRIKTALGLSFAMVSGFLTFAPAANAQYSSDLYDGGRGKYGGKAYQDSSGTYWDQNTQYGDGRYGGGSFSDGDGRTIECDRRGFCYEE